MTNSSIPCMHIDGEFCSKCFPMDKVMVTNLYERIELLERIALDLVKKIGDIANYCYREK